MKQYSDQYFDLFNLNLICLRHPLDTWKLIFPNLSSFQITNDLDELSEYATNYA